MLNSLIKNSELFNKNVLSNRRRCAADTVLQLTRFFFCGPHPFRKNTTANLNGFDSIRILS